ncbi:NeuA CMP-N-acetylneuraminic acid synthetase [Candidatus Nanopelagicaceae bacterium]
MKIVAIIPARAGSKGVKDKNLQKISGVPLVNITINLAKMSTQIDAIYVSSDSDEILKNAENSGVIPLRRPADKADDSATANDVVKHFLNSNPDFKLEEFVIVYLQPTSPFTSSDSLSRCIDLFLERNVSIVSMKKVSEHPNKMLIEDSFGRVSSYIPESEPTTNRQNLLELLIPTGGIYVFSSEEFIKNENIPVINSIPYIVYGIEALDIDDEFDLFLAQTLGAKDEF